MIPLHAAERVVPARGRWYETTRGAAAADLIRARSREALRALDADDRIRALASLLAWDGAVDTSPLTPQALHSIGAAMSDARSALQAGELDDARAFVHAALSMLGDERPAWPAVAEPT